STVVVRVAVGRGRDRGQLVPREEHALKRIGATSARLIDGFDAPAFQDERRGARLVVFDRPEVDIIPGALLRLTLLPLSFGRTGRARLPRLSSGPCGRVERVNGVRDGQLLEFLLAVLLGLSLELVTLGGGAGFHEP